MTEELVAAACLGSTSGDPSTSIAISPEYVPASHGSHELSAVCWLKRPAAHDLHCDAPTVTPVPSEFDVKCPAAQELHVAAPEACPLSI